MKRNCYDNSAIFYLIFWRDPKLTSYFPFFRCPSNSYHCISNCRPQPEICSAEKLGNIQYVILYVCSELQCSILRMYSPRLQMLVGTYYSDICEKLQILKLISLPNSMY